MTLERRRWTDWGCQAGLAFVIALLALLGGCDSSALTTGGAGSGNGGSGGMSSASAGSAGSSDGRTVTFPTTTSIVVHSTPSGTGGTSSSGVPSGSGASAGNAGSPAAQCIPDHPSGSDTDTCGDGVRSSTEACDDGNTQPDDGCSPTCQITPQLASPRARSQGNVTRINSGGGALGQFGEDRLVTGGNAASFGNPISTSSVANAAPAEVYQSERWGDFSYTLTDLVPAATYTVRLHFAEIYFSGAGSRVFNVAINGTRVLENFDIYALVGANQALVRDLSVVADNDGQIVLDFAGVVDNAKLSGLELFPPLSNAGPPQPTTVQIDSGGDGVGSFVADQEAGGGEQDSTDAPVDTTGVANAAPAEVYQSERFGDFQYGILGLTPGATYTVRLHFAENYWTAVGSRVFNVSINGTDVLTNFDIFSVAGGAHKAVVRDFSAVADDDAQIVVQFTSITDNASLSGIEVLVPPDPPKPTPRGRTIGAGRHPLAAGCNALGVAFSDSGDQPAAVYLSRFKPAGQPLSSAQVAQAKVATPNPTVAALPDDDFVVAWTDFDDDELGVSLRKVSGGAAQGKVIVANEDSAFSQSGPDIVFDGNELVVAWVDSRDAVAGPDLRYRLFTPDLKPLTGDQLLANTGAVEDNVVLAGRNGHWAAAWRAGSNGAETIEVQSGSSHWTVGPFAPGATDDRPDLIFLDDSHLAVAFTIGTDPDDTGEANVPRLHAAVLDPKHLGTTESFAVAPARAPYASSINVGQTRPSLVLASDHVLVGWRSEAISGDHLGSELWSRRVPFTVSGDTLTLDPSHLEAPVIQTDAQREGDQDAFRMVATTLWPSGGIASVWDDSSRSFGATAGGPDVVLQVNPDFKEVAPAQSTYAASDDGLYYKVNLLRRNYPGPTVSTAFSGDAEQYLNQFPRTLVFDGDDAQWMFHSVSGTDPNSGATLTIDMGQYFPVGAVRIRYYYTNNAPSSQTLRLSTLPGENGNWQTILDDTVALDDHTYSFNQVPARFLELKMKGLWGAVMEIEVYPSTQAGPPPSPSDGYDLSSFTTLTTNSQCREPGYWDWASWGMYARVAWQAYPPYATDDCVGTYDFGAQYPISKLSLNFYVGSNWPSGGRIDLAATPGAYTNIYDSGVGNQFSYATSFDFPQQPVRYVRVTDDAVPGVGPANGILESIQAFATPPPRVAYYPLSADPNYFNVNILRRPAGEVQPTASVTYGGTAAHYYDPRGDDPGNAIDGNYVGSGWDAGAIFGWEAGANPTTANATLTVDLHQVVPLGAIRQLYQFPSVSYGLRLGDDNGNWTTLVDLNAHTTVLADQTVSFASIPTRYIELTMYGAGPYATLGDNGGIGAALKEIMAYPSSAAPAPNSESHLDLSRLQGVKVTFNENMLFINNNVVFVNDWAPTFSAYWRGYTAAEGATGDATVSFDLGQPYQISQINLFFWDERWASGGKVEVDDGSETWTTVYDTGVGNPLAPSLDSNGIEDGIRTITFTSRPARVVRLTHYLGTDVYANMMGIEIF